MSLRTLQPSLFSDCDAESQLSDSVTTTFVDNMRLPVHRWFRFSAGFSAAWAQNTIREAGTKGDVRVFDPFAGSGTTLIAAEDEKAPAYGIEAHPFVFRLARAKLERRSDRDSFRDLSTTVRSIAATHKPEIEQYPKLIRTCYRDDVLGELDQLRAAIEAVDDGSPASQLVWLALVGILRRCSHAGTAQWQYVLPKKTKKSPARPFSAFEELRKVILHDMAATSQVGSPKANLLQSDARDCAGVPNGFANLVVTSPPYPNNYDYADATRLEMCFFREIRRWSDLQMKVRRHLVRSCSQHVPDRAIELHRVLSEPLLEPIRSEITEVCENMAKIRLTKGGKKTYHLMVSCYFHDLARVWKALRRVCDSPSRVCFVVGDSAPYGIYVPVIDWLGRLAIAAGFRSFRFEKTRDRNIKWKNRKHRVPLCEGRLWVEG